MRPAVIIPLAAMITREEAPDWGSVQIRKKARLGVVPQRPHFADGVTARDYVTSGLDELHKAIALLRQTDTPQDLFALAASERAAVDGAHAGPMPTPN